MTNVQVLLFTSPTCPHCPAAKKWAEERVATDENIDYFLFDSTNPDSAEMAQQFQIRSVPTFVIIGTKYDKPIGVSGTPTKEHFEKLLKLARGEIDEKEL